MSNSTDASAPWDIQAARALYNIHRWGAKYFDINEAGHVVARPLQDAGAAVDLTDVIEEAQGARAEISAAHPVPGHFAPPRRGASTRRSATPSRNSITRANIAACFPSRSTSCARWWRKFWTRASRMISAWKWAASRNCSPAWRCKTRSGCLIICNGYKDAEFIRMALLGIKLGKKVIMVVEKLEELRQIIAISKQIGVEPLIGIRARLLSKGAGKWAESGGENAKFGLSTAELLAATEMLKAENLGHCLKLLHFHIGSQVPDILTVKKAVQEAARFYAKLHKMGFADRVPGRRRRAGRGLRRQPLGVRQLHQLHAAGIHQRHRLLHRRRVQRGESAAPGHHQRKRPRHRRASQRADRRGVRRD